MKKFDVKDENFEKFMNHISQKLDDWKKKIMSRYRFWQHILFDAKN